MKIDKKEDLQEKMIQWLLEFLKNNLIEDEESDSSKNMDYSNK